MCKQNFKTQHTDQIIPNPQIWTKQHIKLQTKDWYFNKFGETWHHPKIKPTMQKSKREDGKEGKSGWLTLSSPKSFKIKVLKKKTEWQGRGKNRTTHKQH